jgi:rhamnulokinase
MTDTTHHYLTVDLGAESGRVILGTLQNGRLALDEIHRFTNGPVRQDDGLHWDVQHLWREIKNGMRIASAQAGPHLSSIGLDTWGVDFGLLDERDQLLADPFHYRDSRTNGMMEKAFAVVSRDEIYRRTGIQFMQFNTLYQLIAMAGSPQLAAARSLLFMPDLFNFWLSGVRANEYTIASTSQCLNPFIRSWDLDLLDRFGIPGRIFGRILPPGSILGNLLPAVAAETGCPPVPVIAVGSHDTASAVAGVPASSEDFIYLSSGTWSLMGMETPGPMVTPASLAHNITNEGGVNGAIRLLKDIMGMWLLQECRAEWAQAGQKYSYDQLTALAADAPAFGSIVHPTDHVFLAPGAMVQRIEQFCRQTGQSVPAGQGQISRCILESLALEYRRVATQLQHLTGRTANTIHIVGGGSRNGLLNQFTADCTGKVVVAGPVEATAAGNILVQAITLGHVTSLQEGREIIRTSFSPQVFQPGDPSAWHEAYQRFTTEEVL